MLTYEEELNRPETPEEKRARIREYIVLTVAALVCMGFAAACMFVNVAEAPGIRCIAGVIA